jgi:hypothetical protein
MAHPTTMRAIPQPGTIGASSATGVVDPEDPLEAASGVSLTEEESSLALL